MPRLDFAYHHFMAVIKAAIAAKASIISPIMSSVVGFFFFRLTLSFLLILFTPFLYIIIAYCRQYVKRFLKKTLYFFNNN